MNTAGSVEDRHRLTALTGTVGLGLDALASVSYGPEAIVLVLAAAGAVGMTWTLPVTGVIVLLLVVLVACYRQVIRAYPDGGGAYTVARRNLGARAGLIAAASLVVDYVLNVAVSIAAGVAALTSAFPVLLPWTVELCLGALALVTLVNLRGLVTSARLFILPTLVFVASVAAVVLVGLVRGAPLHPLPPSTQPATVGAVGVLLVIAAFANGCAALTGVEAIANATPSFRKPRAGRARRAEAGLGAVLGLLLLGLAVLIQQFDARPVDGRTLLSLVAEGSLGSGFGYVVVQMATVLLLALAANTSFGGLPVLAARLASDGYLPHLFGLRADRLVHRYGVLVLAVLAGGLLLFSGGDVAVLVPMFAVGVFIGFFLCQIGMVRHWAADRGRGWRSRAAVNGLGAVFTAVAAIVIIATKFIEGAWLIMLVVPVLVVIFSRVRAAYDRMGRELGVGSLPPQPHELDTLVVVPVAAPTRLAAESLSTALGMGHRVVAVHVTFPGEFDQARAMQQAWLDWRPEVPIVVLEADRRELGAPLARFVRDADAERVIVLIGEVQPRRRWERVLKNHRGAVIARRLSRSTNAVVCRLRLPLTPTPALTAAGTPRP
ncbi:APC family permease [Saccharopolyspora sp. K220]|uniref:APC family permease n=1 Tax=Saccharopolyspora soli TaxID=2926618 RepID=UPI001F560DD3|nr:APC family permease [Saccharopolyspora soli]MCI2420841.1 APC family permease [Saccharopolyspora soli]